MTRKVVAVEKAFEGRFWRWILRWEPTSCGHGVGLGCPSLGP